MVPAIALRDPESHFYLSAIRKCWKFVFSDHILGEYQRVIQEFGFRGDVIIHELNKLHAMNKYRASRSDPSAVPEAMAPRKDKHIIAPCCDVANVVVSMDRGILQRKQTIAGQYNVNVYSLDEAQHVLDRLAECP